MTKPKAIILEIDGVLSDDSHRRHLIDCVNEPFYLIDPNPKLHPMFFPTFIENPKFGASDYEAYHAAGDKDGVNKSILIILESLWVQEDASIVFITQRFGKYREITEDWIHANINRSFVDFKLFMRPHFLPHSCYGCRNDKPELHNKYISEKIDNRPSTEIKREIYEREIRDKYDVLFVLERSGPDAQMYRELGLTVLTC